MAKTILMPNENDNDRNMVRVMIVGARSARQGLGPFVAECFTRAGADVGAIVGTSHETVAAAQAHLHEAHGLTCRGYTHLGEALRKERMDAVAICSPIRHHAEHLAAVLAAGAHCLCEKPLFEPRAGAFPGDHKTPDAEAGSQIVAGFANRGLLLETVTQWPMTLPAYDAVHPDVRKQPIVRFEMGLSPISTGPSMVADAGPHFVSMLRALCGRGELADIRAISPGTAEVSGEATGAGGKAGRADSVTVSPSTFEQVTLTCRYVHGGGETTSALHLAQCSTRPRPAWYAINGRKVDREIELPAYRQYFACGEHRTVLDDPLALLVQRFLTGVHRGRPTDTAALIEDQVAVTRLYAAVCGGGGGSEEGIFV